MLAELSTILYSRENARGWQDFRSVIFGEIVVDLIQCDSASFVDITPIFWIVAL